MGQSLEEEQAKLSLLKEAYQQAVKENNSAKQNDLDRIDGSPRQDKMHEERMRKCSDGEWSAKREMDEQARVVQALIDQSSASVPGQ